MTARTNRKIIGVKNRVHIISMLNKKLSFSCNVSCNMTSKLISEKKRKKPYNSFLWIAFISLNRRSLTFNHQVLDLSTVKG